MALPQIIGDGLEFRTYTVRTSEQPLILDQNEPEKVVEFILRADPANAATIYIGDSSRQLFPLLAGEVISIPVTKRANLYFKGGNATDKLHAIFALVSAVPYGLRIPSTATAAVAKKCG